MTQARRNRLAYNLYRECVLPLVDRGLPHDAAAIIDGSLAEGVIDRRTARRMTSFVKGREMLAVSDRATFYWNRFMERTLHFGLDPGAPTTYCTVRPGTASSGDF